MRAFLMVAVLVAGCGGPDRFCDRKQESPPVYEMDCACPLHYRDAPDAGLETVPITTSAESCERASFKCNVLCRATD